MRLIKKLNNNYAFAVDSNGTPLIVKGSGIGFGKFPVELNDLSAVEKTFYSVDERIAQSVMDVPEDILELATELVSKTEQTVKKKLNPSTIFTLADHINYSIKRIKQGIPLKYAFAYEVGYQYPEEMRLSRQAVKQIEKQYEVMFSKSETAMIAMHLVEAENYEFSSKVIYNNDLIISQVMEIVKKQLHISIQEDDFNYVRFVTHLNHLISRIEEGQQIISDDNRLFLELVKEYPDIYTCVLDIKNYLKTELKYKISEEEMLYLMLHINRLICRETRSSNA